MTLCCVLIKVPVSLFQKYIIDLQAESLPKKQVPLYAVIHVSLHVLFLSKLFPGFLHPQNRTHLPFVTSNMQRRVRLGQLNTSWDRGCLQVSAFVLRKLLISNEASSCCLSGKILFSGLRSKKKINRNNYTCNTPAQIKHLV